MRRATFWLFLLLVGCGKIGDPQSPFIRIPQAVTDLAVHQNGNELVLSWTNPSRNIDGSGATDLARIQIRSNGSGVATVNVTAPARVQSHSFPLGNGPRTFTLVVETTRGKASGVSNTVSITPVNVPGRVTALRGLADQRRITLSWEKPREHPELADMYLVRRTQPPADPEYVSETRYEDNRYRPNQSYSYDVTAARRLEGNPVPGIGSEPITVVAEDKTPPQVPTGLDISVTDTGAFVTWAANSERDLAGYRVFRSDRPDGEFKLLTPQLQTNNAFFDADYRSGLYYAVSSVDEFGNESAKSAPRS